jgi:hypothetical protein
VQKTYIVCPVSPGPPKKPHIVGDKPETKANEEWTSQRQVNEEWTSQRQRQMKNGQVRDKGNIGYTRYTTETNKTQKHTTTMKKCW